MLTDLISVRCGSGRDSSSVSSNGSRGGGSGSGGRGSISGGGRSVSGISGVIRGDRSGGNDRNGGRGRGAGWDGAGVGSGVYGVVARVRVRYEAHLPALSLRYREN